MKKKAKLNQAQCLICMFVWTVCLCSVAGYFFSLADRLSVHVKCKILCLCKGQFLNNINLYLCVQTGMTVAILREIFACYVFFLQLSQPSCVMNGVRIDGRQLDSPTLWLNTEKTWNPNIGFCWVNYMHSMFSKVSPLRIREGNRNFMHIIFMFPIRLSDYRVVAKELSG